MHDTALKIGGLVLRTYCPMNDAAILEIGSQDMNGSLRDLAPKGAEYIGMDYEDGKGVDIVLTPDVPWPVEDDHFDLVLASSVFEHDVAFWVTFEAMCRKAKPGGHVYISAPSNGIVHRCPQDYWRFYPDSALALQNWVERQGLQVTMVESFMADREADMWNDFCAIFRREPSPEPLNRNYVYQKVPCTNAIVWERDEVLNPQTNSQDMILLAEERQQVKELRDHIGWREHMIAGEKTAWEGEREVLVRNAAEASIAKEALAIRIAALEDEFAAERKALIQTEQRLRDHIVGLEAKLEHSATKGAAQAELVESLQERVRTADAQLAEAVAARQALEAHVNQAKQDLVSKDQRIGQLESNLAQRRAEIEQAWADVEEEKKAREAAEVLAGDHAFRAQEAGRDLDEAQERLYRLSQRKMESERELSDLSRRLDKAEQVARYSDQELSRLETGLGRLHQAEQKATKEIGRLQDELARSKAAQRSLSSEVEKLRLSQSQRNEELVRLTAVLDELEKRNEQLADRKKWLREVHAALRNGRPWWWELMPPRWRRTREYRRLARLGLFDAGDYLLRRPDVKAEGFDPLHHYIMHGLDEVMPD